MNSKEAIKAEDIGIAGSRCALICALVIGLLGCGTMQPQAPAEPAAVQVFVPIDPVSYSEFFEGELEYYDADRDGEVSSNADWLSRFPNIAAEVTIGTVNQDGSVSYGPVGVSARGGSYVVTVDYVKYRTDRGAEFIYRSGVGMRLRASLKTNQAGVNLSGLFGIGFAANQGKLTGTLYFEVLGIQGTSVDALVPVPSEISVESIQGAIQAVAAIKAKVYDTDEVFIDPVVFARKEYPAKITPSASPISAQ